jgi:hypothetical protein
MSHWWSGLRRHGNFLELASAGRNACAPGLGTAFHIASELPSASRIFCCDVILTTKKQGRAPLPAEARPLPVHTEEQVLDGVRCLSPCSISPASCASVVVAFGTFPRTDLSADLTARGH